MVKAHKLHREPLDFRLERSLGTTLFQFSWFKPFLKNSNRVLEDLNITDYPQSVIILVSQPFLAAGTIARVLASMSVAYCYCSIGQVGSFKVLRSVGA